MTRPDILARRALELLADKWMIDVFRQLSVGSKRYTELQEAISGVSGSVLTNTLRRMERNGLVVRNAEATIPPRVEYGLTPLGESLEEPLAALTQWGEHHLDDVDAARRMYKRRERGR